MSIVAEGYVCWVNEEELNAGLTEKQKETFEKFKDCTSELSCITEREAFSSGFILATRIMLISDVLIG